MQGSVGHANWMVWAPSPANKKAPPRPGARPPLANLRGNYPRQSGGKKLSFDEHVITSVSHCHSPEPNRPIGSNNNADSIVASAAPTNKEPVTQQSTSPSVAPPQLPGSHHQRIAARVSKMRSIERGTGMTWTTRKTSFRTPGKRKSVLHGSTRGFGRTPLRAVEVRDGSAVVFKQRSYNDRVQHAVLTQVAMEQARKWRCNQLGVAVADNDGTASGGKYAGKGNRSARIHDRIKSSALHSTLKEVPKTAAPVKVVEEQRDTTPLKQVTSTSTAQVTGTTTPRVFGSPAAVPDGSFIFSGTKPWGSTKKSARKERPCAVVFNDEDAQHLPEEDRSVASVAAQLALEVTDEVATEDEPALVTCDTAVGDSTVVAVDAVMMTSPTDQDQAALPAHLNGYSAQLCGTQVGVMAAMGLLPSGTGCKTSDGITSLLW